jgi:hypothetical protein
MEKLMILDLMTAIDEMVDDEELDQFEVVTDEVIQLILERAKEIADEE